MARPTKKTSAKAAATTAKTAAPKKKSASKAAAKPAAAAKAAPAVKKVAKKVALPAKQEKPAAKPAKTAAKSSSKAPAAPPKPPVRKAAPLSAKEAESVRAELTEQRATLERELEDLDLGSLHVAQSELSGEVSFDEEYADAGTFTFERERDLSLSNNIRDLMDKVDSALRKLDDGTYGTCERCGNAINKERLRALPYSVLCITCKQLEERIH